MTRTAGLLLASLAIGCVVPSELRTDHVLTGEAFPPHEGNVRIVMARWP